MSKEMTVTVELTTDDKASEGIEKAAKNAGSAFDQIADRSSRLSQGMSDLGKTLSTLGATWMGSVMVPSTKAAEWGDMIEETGQKTGIASEELQFYQYAANLTGSSLEGFTAGIRKLQLSLYSASQGGEEATRAFEALGVSTTNADGSTRSVSDLLPEIADGYQRLTDESQRTNVATQIFGKGCMALKPMLAEGSTGLKQLRDGFDEAGGVVDTKGLEKWKDDLDSLKQAVLTVTRAFGAAMAPVMDWIARIATKAAGAFARFTKEHPVLARVVGMVVLALGALLAVIGPILLVIPTIASGLGFLATAFGGASVAAGGFGAALWAALAPLLPIILPIVAAVALIGVALYLLWTRCSEFRTFVVGMWEVVKGSFYSAVQALKPVFAFIASGFRILMAAGMQLLQVLNSVFGTLNKVFGFDSATLDPQAKGTKKKDDAKKPGGFRSALTKFAGGGALGDMDLGDLGDMGDMGDLADMGDAGGGLSKILGSRSKSRATGSGGAVAPSTSVGADVTSIVNRLDLIVRALGGVLKVQEQGSGGASSFAQELYAGVGG